ncbi:MAG: signal peptidase I [Nanobdellota archaeon]
MSTRVIWIVVIMFTAGFLSASLLQGTTLAQSAELNIPSRGGVERDSPGDYIKTDQIKVYDEKIEINVKNAKWAILADTNSMDPVLDKEASVLQFVPTSPDEIQRGDIISYNSNESNTRIIHRVVYKGTDEDGTYFIVKGDNNKESDPGKVRFGQVERVLFGIIY